MFQDKGTYTEVEIFECSGCEMDDASFSRNKIDQSGAELHLMRAPCPSKPACQQDFEEDEGECP